MIKAPDVTALYVMLAFVVSYVVLKRFLFVPLGAILEAREQEESAAAKIHAESRRELERAIAEGERKLALARREALKERETLRAQGLTRFEQELGRAREAATSAVEGASRTIDVDAARAASELATRSRSLAVELAEKILGRKLAA
jgi:F-type H+-transporting ATPase subunit b